MPNVIMRAQGWTLEIRSNNNVIVPRIDLNRLNVSYDPPDMGPRFGDLTVMFYADLPQDHRLWNYCMDQTPENQPPPATEHTIRVSPNREAQSWNDFDGCRLCSINFSDLDFSQNEPTQIEMTWKFRETNAHLTDPIERFRNRPFPRLGKGPQLQKLDWRKLGF